jgi:SAM-dependent methyltransferase
MTRYFFDQAWEDERRRLDALGALHDPDTFARLGALGLRAGWRCLEVGAGSGTVARWMAARGVRVVATDLDPRFLAPLEGEVEIRRHDVVEDPLEEGAYDLVHARALLQHVARREHVVAKLARALRPGGVLCLEDILMPTGDCDPPLPGFREILGAMGAGLRASGADPGLGIKLPRLLREAGLSELGSDARVPLVASGTPRADFYVHSFAHARDRLVAAGVVAAQDVDQLLAALRAPGYTMTAAVMIAAWGRRP